MKYQYVDPHNEGTFVTNGNRYYLSQLYGKSIGIIKRITFYPLGAGKGNAQSFTSSKGTSRPVYSSGHLNNRIILLFDVPGIDPSQLQYYCYLDTDAMMFPANMDSKEKVDQKEFELEQAIQEQVYYSKLDTLGKLWYHIKPFALPLLVIGGIYTYSKLRD